MPSRVRSLLPRDSEAAYALLPISLQNLAISYIGANIEWRRYDSGFARLLAGYESRSPWGQEELAAYRDRTVATFVQDAARRVPYYRRLFSKLGIGPDDIRTLADLSHLPLLHKAEIQADASAFVPEGTPLPQRIAVHTSGTTGAGVHFLTSLTAQKEQWAVWWRYRGWHGIQRGTWCGNFTGRSIVPLPQTKPPYWRYNVPGRQIVFSAYHLGRSTAGAYLAELRRRRPRWLHGYPSVLALLAGYLMEAGEELGFPLRWVTVGAENLLESQRDVITRGFGVRPLQHYGMAEAAANVSECEHGRLHVDEDFAAVEFVPDAASGTTWVVGTNFTNSYTPLVRYVIGDLGELATDQSCSCGRGGRLVSTLDGRSEDYVVLANGARLGRMDHIFKDMVNIREAQIRQARPGEITLCVVRGSRYGPGDEDALLFETRRRVGDDTEIRMEYLDNLPRTATGKLRLVVSEVR